MEKFETKKRKAFIESLKKLIQNLQSKTEQSEMPLSYKSNKDKSIKEQGEK